VDATTLTIRLLGDPRITAGDQVAALIGPPAPAEPPVAKSPATA
jgi:hypothetical protein